VKSEKTFIAGQRLGKDVPAEKKQRKTPLLGHQIFFANNPLLGVLCFIEVYLKDHIYYNIYRPSIELEHVHK
jgi:hypothetical protein